MESQEIWKDMEGFEGFYRISNMGRVFSIKTSKIRATSVNNSGYETIHLYKNACHKSATVHRLVALAFVPNHNNYSEINHLNENKLDNRADNLEWCSRRYNQVYSGNIERWTKAGALGGKMKRSKKVYQFTLEGDFIKEWFSAREAQAELGLARTGIGKCCLGKYKTYGGFLWSFQPTLNNQIQV